MKHNLPFQTVSKLTYRKPVLRELGDLRALTLGSSTGNTDSGGQGADPGVFGDQNPFPPTPIFPTPDVEFPDF